MVKNPTTQYTYKELVAWFEEAQALGESLTIDPCNPMDVPFLQTSAVIEDRDGIATLMQWLGGIPSGE